MYNLDELVEKIKMGAKEDPNAAVEACQIIIDQGVLAFLSPPTKKKFPSNPTDKGKQMISKKTSKCRVCGLEIKIGEDIYFKGGEGAGHVSCVDLAAPTYAERQEDVPPF
jgi:hypothetical protein